MLIMTIMAVLAAKLAEKRSFVGLLDEYTKRLDDGEPSGSLSATFSSTQFDMSTLDIPCASMPFAPIAPPVDLSRFAKNLRVEEISESNAEIRRKIGALSDRIARFFPTDGDAILAPYLESAENARSALLPLPGSTSLSIREAKAALPKLIEFVAKLENVTEIVLTIKATTSLGATATVEEHFPERPRQSAALPERPVLGEYARRFVKEVDWDRRVITFKGKHHPKVVMPLNSDKAWNYLLRLLTSTHPQGWVELGTDLNVRWAGYFNRTDKEGAVIEDNPLTYLRCRIESNHNRGRPRDSSRKVQQNEPPMIRLVSFDTKKFAQLNSLTAKPVS